MMSVCTCAYSSTISSSLLNEYFQPLILIKLGFATKAKKIAFQGTSWIFTLKWKSLGNLAHSQYIYIYIYDFQDLKDF